MWRARFASLLAIAFAGLAPDPAPACSVCLAGDPSFDATGASAGQSGDWSFFLQGTGWEKKSGTLPGEGDGDGSEKNASRRIDTYLAWTPVDRLTFTLDLPIAFNRITEYEDGESESSSLSGIGDLSLMASGVLWRDREVLPGTWVEARAFLKAPTGKSETSVGGVKDPHLQRGTGSWDYGFGLAVTHKLALATLYASTFYRVNTYGSLHYEYGDAALANLAVLMPLGHATGMPALDAFTPGFELNYRWAQRDTFQGEDYDDSGGSILYLTPSLRVALPREFSFGGRPVPSLRFSLQVPATSRWLHGFQQEDPTWRAGLFVPL